MKVPAKPVEGEWYEFVIPVSAEDGTSYARGKCKHFDHMSQSYVFTVRERTLRNLPSTGDPHLDPAEPMELRVLQVEEVPELVVRFDRFGIERHVKLPLVEDDPLVTLVEVIALAQHEADKRRKRGEG